MNSTYNSSDLIVDIKNLEVAFNLDVYRNNTLRDLFVGTLSNPIKMITDRKKHVVLNGIDLQINKGEKVAIMGVNGAGKTTLCRAIAGMYQSAEGAIKVNGGVRAIFDTNVGIVPELTGKENAHLMVQFIYPDKSKSEREAIVKEALNFSGLDEFIHVPFDKYSKGMQARLCLSLVSARASDLLILDEVFDGADEFFQKRISKRILNLIDSSGAVIFVSHNREQVREACNRLIILADRKIFYDGEVEKGLEYYSLMEENFKINPLI
jgi:ABC-type polysaccharide/polyol phosphate transport system ATPase subunit